MNSIKVNETIFSDVFVSPGICETLAFAGITKDVPYSFRVGHDYCIPFTYAYDTDNVYKQMDANTTFSDPSVKVIPAYTVKDLERVLDGYTLHKKDKNVYQLSVHHYNNVHTVFAERLPDAFANMIIQLLQHRLINVHSINERILHL